jgi:hypothetical protein
MYCRLGDGGESCQPIEPYDAAGVITVTGLAMPVTMSPPVYSPPSFTSTVFAGGTVRATASGATSAGMGEFELSLGPPSDVVATPALASLSAASFTGAVPLAWNPGTDAIDIELFVSGTGSYAHGLCHTEDDGSFSLPAGLTAAFPAESQVVRIDLKRVREVVADDVDAFGVYFGTELPDDGEAILRLVRLETASIVL